MIETARHSQQMAAAWSKADEFNAAYPVGTEVIYRSLIEDSGEIQETKTRTRSAAWALECADAVVMIDGKAGGVLLDHVSPVGV